MAEARVVVVPRKPNGRKRTGGGYLGRNKQARKTFSPALRRLAELLAGPGWHTLEEMAQATGTDPYRLKPRLSEIRRFGPPEFSVLKSYGRNGQNEKVPELRGRPQRPIFFRVERTNTNASD